MYMLISFLMKNTISYWKLCNTFVWTPAEVLWKIHKSNSLSPSYSQYVSQSWTISYCDIQYIQYNIMCGEDNAFASNFVVVAKVLHKPTWPLPPPPPTKIHLLITLLRNSVTSPKRLHLICRTNQMIWRGCDIIIFLIQYCSDLNQSFIAQLCFCSHISSRCSKTSKKSKTFSLSAAETPLQPFDWGHQRG